MLKKKAANMFVRAIRSGCELSDEDFKRIDEHIDPEDVARALLLAGPPFTKAELKHIVQFTKDKYGDYDFDKDGHRWKDDILDGYAEHIKNYYYKYKPEATEIDSDIDPEEMHIGPMAQDIEEVNPACITETPEGVKTVDTGRLALMNAGAIAELARQIKEMKNAVAT
jgi:hypothetical protein